MQKEARTPRDPAATRQKLIDATVSLILKQGFAATTVDQICAAAGVTKGSFFHHFDNKEAAGQTAIDWWSDMGTSLYAEAWRDPDGDPLEQLHRMLDIMAGFGQQPGDPCTCVVGIMSQEVAQSNDTLRQSCSSALELWTANVARLLAAARQRHPVARDFDPQQAAWFLNAIWQGSMLIAKTARDPRILLENLRQARLYIDSLFQPTTT